MQSVSSNAVYNAISQAESWSETGVRIGTWIDGSPLYRKAIKLQVPSNGNYSAPLNENNARVVNWRGNFFQHTIASPSWIMHIPYTYFDQTNLSTMINIYVYYDPNGGSFQCSFYGSGPYASAYFNGWAVLYVEYTKS